MADMMLGRIDLIFCIDIILIKDTKNKSTIQGVSMFFFAGIFFPVTINVRSRSHLDLLICDFNCFHYLKFIPVIFLNRLLNFIRKYLLVTIGMLSNLSCSLTIFSSTIFNSLFFISFTNINKKMSAHNGQT
jgi:hypothetical protein